MKRWLTVFVMITGVFLFLFGVAFAQPNLDGTLSVTVEGDRRLNPQVQQAVQQYLQGKGFNVVMSGRRRSHDTPYGSLEIYIDWQRGQTTNSGLRLGKFSKNTTIHHDTVMVTVTLYSPGGRNAMALSTGTATLDVEWQESHNSYRSRYGGNSQSSGQDKLKEAAVQATLQALNQIQLVTAQAPTTFASFIEKARQVGKNVSINIETKDGEIIVGIGNKIGRGQTLDEALQNALLQ